MKKYCFIILISALLLSGCDNSSSTREFITPDLPHLTTMTMTTSIPVDTYSQYMETYTSTEPETVNSNRFYYHGTFAGGVSADTMATVPTAGRVSMVTADTPMTTTAPPETEPEPESSGSETVTTEIQETTEYIETVTATANIMESAPADTVFSNRASTDTGTVPQVTTDTMLKNTSNRVSADIGTVPSVTTDTMYKNTSNGGTDNADQHTQ